jgi:hypothetical protein
VRLLRRGPKFDLAVLDVKLTGPDRNSLGIAALLAAEGTPFIFLTGMRVDDVHAKQFPDAPGTGKAVRRGDFAECGAPGA